MSGRRGGYSRLGFIVAVAIAVGACSSSGAATNAPTATSGGGGTKTPAATATANGGSGSGSDVLTGAAANLSKIKSYKFAMTMKGGKLGQLAGGLPITGAVTTDPKAAQMSFMGMEVIEVGGQTYVKMGGQWIAGDSSSSSMADSFAPDEMFGSSFSGSAADGYRLAGEETKNGVKALHFTADAKMLEDYGSLFGVEGNATWSADAWVAKDGGYPVSMAVKATGGDQAFELTIDITNINDSSIKIEKPSGVTELPD